MESFLQVINISVNSTVKFLIFDCIFLLFYYLYLVLIVFCAASRVMITITRRDSFYLSVTNKPISCQTTRPPTQSKLVFLVVSRLLCALAITITRHNAVSHTRAQYARRIHSNVMRGTCRDSRHVSQSLSVAEEADRRAAGIVLTRAPHLCSVQ